MGGVRSTIVENGRTIRTWQETRDHGTYIRKFYINYECIAFGIDGRNIRRIVSTKEEAANVVRDWVSRCERHYSIRPLRTDRVAYSHDHEIGFWIIGPANIFAIETGSGEPVIFEGYE